MAVEHIKYMRLSFNVKPRPQTPKPQTQKPNTKGPWAYTKISWATTTTPPHPQLLSMKEGSHNKPQRVRKVQSGPAKKSQVYSERKDME